MDLVLLDFVSEIVIVFCPVVKGFISPDPCEKTTFEEGKVDEILNVSGI